LLGEFVLIAGIAYDDSVRQVLTHESQHAAASETLGALRTGFMLNLAKSDNGSALWQLMHQASMVTTKLGLAAAAAHPTVPSPGDMDDIHGMGYDGGIDELGYKIVAHNQATTPGLTIPVPLSYAPSTAQIIDLAGY